MANTFTFVGNVAIPKGEDKNHNSRFIPVYKKADWETKRINFLVKPSKNDGQFVSLTGAKPTNEAKNPIMTMDSDFQKLTIAWQDRFNPDILDKVAYVRQFSTNIGGEQITFVHAYDFITYLAENLKASQRVNVSGSVNFRPYNGKIQIEYQIQKVWLAKEEDKSGTFLHLDLFYNEGCLDKTRIDDQIIDMKAYVSQYIDKDIKNQYIPIALVFDGSKIDMTNVKQKDVWENRINHLTAGSTFVKLGWRIKVFTGAEEVDFDESMLTDAQREEIALGVATIDDFKPSGNMFGNNKTEYKLISPNLRYTYKDGAIDTGNDVDDFMKNVYTIAPTEASIQDVMTDDVLPDDDEDLFA